MSGRLLPILGVAALAPLLLWPGRVVAQGPPTITHAVPAAVAPGATTDVTLFGKDLAGLSAVWQSGPGEAALTPDVPGNGQQPTFARVRFKLPETGCGLIGVRAGTGGGVSNLLVMLVDDLPSIVDSGRNQSPTTPQNVTLPIAIDGFCAAESARYYQLSAKQGERLAVEVFARRLGSPLDPVVRLLDAEGRELVYCDDEPGLAGDGRFAYVFPADGTYQLELRDIRFAGGEAHRYRLRLGNFPLATGGYPAAIPRGAASEIEIVGPTGNVGRANVAAAADPAVRQFAPRFKQASDAASAIAVVGVSDLPQDVEAEPNNQPEQANRLALEHGISGRFEQAKDIDRYQLTGIAGEPVAVSWQTQPIGSPAELLVRAVASDGRVIAVSNPSEADDGFELNLPPDGRSTLEVSELHGRSGLHFTYHLEARRPKPSFSLAINRDRANVPHGGALALNVSAARNRYDGPITLAVFDAGQPLADAVLSGNVIAAGANESKLTVMLPTTLAPGTVRQLAIVGTGPYDEAGAAHPIRAVATTGAALRKQNELLSQLPIGLDEAMLLGVGPAFPQFFELTLEPAEVVLPRLVNSGTLKIKTKRSANFSGEIALSIEGLPPGVEAKPAMLGQGVNEISIAVVGKAELPLGDTPIRVLGSAVFQDQPKQFSLATQLRRIQPIRARITPAGTLAIEGKQKVKVAVERFTAEKGPVEVSIDRLPEGVTGPASVTIPEGHDSVEMELAAALTAKPGKDQPITATAKSRVMGEEITVASEPAALEIVDGK